MGDGVRRGRVGDLDDSPPPWAESDPNQVDFIEHRHHTGGPITRVHVALPATDRLDWWERMWTARPIYRELYPPGDGPTWLFLAPVPAMCGLLAINPGLSGGRDQWTTTFADELLCGTCRRTWIASGRDVALLFEHPQPGVVELDDLEDEENR